MIRPTLPTPTLWALYLSVLAVGCGDDGGGVDPDGGTGLDDAVAADGGEGEAITLANCDASVEAAAAPFYQQYFACSDISVTGAGTQLFSTGLPPHPSAYYPADDPNYVAFDDRGGTHQKNPNELTSGNYTFTIPDAPVAKGITIDAALVDNSMNTSADEYGGGPVGMALNGVVIFAAMAAVGDELADEQFTFDSYEAHPAGTTYHYHFNTPGPLEVLVDRGYSSTATPGAGAVELYGVLCDGTVVMGCAELDGSAPSGDDFDAQNGHVHDISDGDTTHFAERYHTHVCPGSWPDYPFFPEIAYYETTGCPAMGGP